MGEPEYLSPAALAELHTASHLRTTCKPTAFKMPRWSSISRCRRWGSPRLHCSVRRVKVTGSRVLSDENLLDRFQRAAFAYFLEEYNSANGLVADHPPARA